VDLAQGYASELDPITACEVQQEIAAALYSERHDVGEIRDPRNTPKVDGIVGSGSGLEVGNDIAAATIGKYEQIVAAAPRNRVIAHAATDHIITGRTDDRVEAAAAIDLVDTGDRDAAEIECVDAVAALDAVGSGAATEVSMPVKPLRPITLSPSPPRMRSVPAPPSMLSTPLALASYRKSSSPSRPASVSLPAPPAITSSPAEPVIASKPLRPSIRSMPSTVMPLK
jgi:hypothetical protein